MNTEKISIIIPVLNETRVLAATLATTQSAADVEVIVVDGGSQDGTIQLAESLGIKVMSTLGGRAYQMNVGAKAATGDVLLFLHADTRLPALFDALILRTLAPSRRNAPVAGAFALQIDGSLPGLRLIERAVNWRSRWLQMPYGDQAIFLRTGVFQALRGFPNLPIMEDFEFIRRLRRLGKIAIVPVPVLTSGRRWQELGVLKTTLVNQGAVVAYLLRVSPARIARWYCQERRSP